MSEATAALVGDNGGAGAPAGEPGAQPSWAEGFSEDTVAYVQNKGWAGEKGIDHGKVIESYQNLEKFAGGSKNLVEMPGVDAPPEAMEKFYNRLGRPESADQYQFKMNDGGDPELFGWFQQSAHKHGLTEKQAAGFLGDYEEMAGGRVSGMAENLKAQAEADIADLRKELGAGYDAHIESGRRAANALGYDEQRLSALEDKMGTGEMLRLFGELGKTMGEDTFEDGGRSGNSGFGVTPAQAKQEMADLKMDKAFMDSYLSGNKEAVAKMTRLMGLAHHG